MKKLTLLSISMVLCLICSGQTDAGKSLAQGEFKKWAPTPPMGWNSWDCYGPSVVEQEVLANVDYMASKLKPFGWEYIVVDARWFAANQKGGKYNLIDPQFVIDEYGRYMPAVNRFPSAANGMGFKKLADYIHSKGLKFGFHIMRGIPIAAVERKLPIKGTNGITVDQIVSQDTLCVWLKENYTIVANRPGAQEYYNSLMELYASWGLDFIKVDDLSQPYHKGEIDLVRNAINKCGRPIVLSTSPGQTPVTQAAHIKNHANMWRQVEDVWDIWGDITHVMDVSKKWYPYIEPGNWPDCDMLPLGRIGIRSDIGTDRMTNLTKDEQYSLMTMWTIVRSPLFFGGDMPSNDDFTLSLLTNPEVIEITKNSTNNRLLSDDGNRTIWLADDPKTGDTYAALFYADDKVKIDPSLATYTSKLLTRNAGEQSTEMKVAVKDAKKLYLVVDDGGDGYANDLANWIEPKLTGAKGTLKLTDLKWQNASAGWGTPHVNKNVCDNKLNVESIEYTEGIGTHSNSIIEYDLPEGYDTLTSKAGLEYGAVGKNGGATVKFLVFLQNPVVEKPADSLKMNLNLKQLGITDKCKVRDLWAKKDVGIYSDVVTLDVKNHGTRLIRISKTK